MPVVSIAIETSCRRGGVALGCDDELIRQTAFDASARHATVLVRQLGDLLHASGMTAGDVHELYVSAGPGSFTGTRVGVTVARTWAQAHPSIRCVAVPSPRAVVRNVEHLAWNRCAVVLDAREGVLHVTWFVREEGQVRQDAQVQLMSVEELLAAAQRPILLVGEGLEYYRVAGKSIELAPADLNLPTPSGVWHVGRRLAQEGRFTDASRLLPIYARKPEALRLWEARHERGRQ